MEFISGKIADMKRALEQAGLSTEQKKLFEELTDITQASVQQQDLLTARLLELEEKAEQTEQQLRDLQLIFLKNFEVDECGMPQTETGCTCGHEHDDGCGCGECDPERPDDFYTLQCPFCEELFFIEKEELDLDIECPFCGKTLKAAENIVKP